MSKRREVAYILNPAPEGERFMQMMRAEALVAKGKAEWEPGTNRLRILREGEAEAIRLEMMARYRREGDQYVEQMIQDSRFSAVSWSGSSRKHLAPFERARMAPICPGTARS